MNPGRRALIKVERRFWRCFMLVSAYKSPLGGGGGAGEGGSQSSRRPHSTTPDTAVWFHW